MTPFEAAALILVGAATVSWLNARGPDLPDATALVVSALLVAGTLTAADAVLPSLNASAPVREALAAVRFEDAVLDFMLAGLLFAGALASDPRSLAENKWAVALMVSVGTVASTALFAAVFAPLAGVPLVTALLAGAVLSPTDPVAVNDAVRRTPFPRSVRRKLSGESLFNDGTAVVAVAVLADVAAGEAPGVTETAADLAVTLLGGAAVGAASGFACDLALNTVRRSGNGVLLTLATAAGSFALADALGGSAPLAAATAGLAIDGRRLADARASRDVRSFWNMIDVVLNAALFVMVGLQAMQLRSPEAAAVLAAVPAALLGRAAAVLLPAAVLRPVRRFTPGAAPLLVAGGLRGGVSLALALSLPEGPHKDAVVSAASAVVLFSLLVQAPLVPALTRRLNANSSDV